MIARSKPARWRRRKPERMNGPEMHELRRGDETLAIVQACRSGDGYFWYGGGKNTSGEPPQPLDEAKSAAAAHVKGKP
jgi:hypothetical protein